MIHSWT